MKAEVTHESLWRTRSNHRRAVDRAKQPDTDYCEFKKFVKSTEWTFYYTKGSSKRLVGPAYGERPLNAPIRRCPRCNKRLKLRARFCVGGEFITWELPEHKPRETRKPSPKRKSRTRGRGK